MLQVCAASVVRMPMADGGFCLCCILHALTCSLLSFSSCSGEETRYRLDFWEFRTTLWCEIFRITRYVLLWLQSVSVVLLFILPDSNLPVSFPIERYFSTCRPAKSCAQRRLKLWRWAGL